MLVGLALTTTFAMSEIVDISDDEDEVQFSQATAPPSSQPVDDDSDDSVIILTDEPPTPKHSQPSTRPHSRSSDVITISDDDSDAAPSSPLPRSSLPPSSPVSRRDDDDDDDAFGSDEDLPDIPIASGSRKRRVDEAEVDTYLEGLKSARNASTSSLESMPSPKKRKTGKASGVNVGQKVCFCHSSGCMVPTLESDEGYKGQGCR